MTTGPMFIGPVSHYGWCLRMVKLLGEWGSTKAHFNPFSVSRQSRTAPESECEAVKVSKAERWTE